MNIRRSTKPTSYQTGTQRAPCESDKPPNGTLISFASTRKKSNSINREAENSCAFSLAERTDVILLVHFQFLLSLQFASEPPFSVLNSEPILSTGWEVFPKNQSNWLKINSRLRVKFLHAETLVANWTTAFRIPLLRSSKAQLASLLLLLCTLAIATRCYASAYSTHPQIDKSASTFSPIRNSKLHSSNLALSRLILPRFSRKRARRDIGRTNSNLVQEGLYPQTKGPFVEVKIKNLVAGEGYRRPGSSAVDDGAEGPSDIRLGENLSDVVSVIGNFTRVTPEKLNYSVPEAGRPDKQLFQEEDRRLMPPVDGHDTYSSVDKWGVVVSIIVSSVALTVTFGLITCILSHYRAGAAGEGGGTASDPNNAALTPTSEPMLSVVSAGATAGVGGMERLRGGRTSARDLAAAREQQVRLHALRTDLAVNLPPSIAMPDGEDHPYSNARIHIRDAEQEAEIYQKCIRPPPNRTVLESESPPPYRSSSAGLLGSSSSSSTSSSADWTLGGMSNAPLVERCHSMSSTTRRPDQAGATNQKTDLLQRTVKILTGKRTTSQAPSPAPTLPVVVVPSRRRPPEQNTTAHRKGNV